MEAEFVALDKAAKEAEWLRSCLEGIPLWPKPMTAVCIHYDSMAALTRAKNHIYNGKSRHIRRQVKTYKAWQIVLKIHVEEDNKMNEKADAYLIETNVNMVGESSSKSKSNHINKGKKGGGSGQKSTKDGKKYYTQQKNNFKKVYHCWVCGKPRHKDKYCRHKKEYGGRNSRRNSNQANHVESPK
ncbi:hypothetical protein Tco_0518194 [Tanacetum coccineum]